MTLFFGCTIPEPEVRFALASLGFMDFIVTRKQGSVVKK
jgi:hypothetical protein